MDSDELWEKIREKSGFQDEIDKLWQEINDKNVEKTKMRIELTAKLYDQRMAELARIKPKQEPDFSQIDFSLFDYPELDGSVSCQNLGSIIVTRTLGIPYKWGERPDWKGSLANYPFHNERSPDQFSPWHRRVDSSLSSINMNNFAVNNPSVMLFKVVPDVEKTNERTKTVIEDFFGHFIGTNGAYLSLIGPRKPPEDQREIKRVSNFGHDLWPAELLIVNRKPCDTELEAMHAAEIELDIRAFAYDALVFVSGRDNPVDDMKLEDIKEIYLTAEGNERAGKNTHLFNWNEYGGPDKQLNAYDHDQLTGFREILDQCLLGVESEKRDYSRNLLSYGLSHITSTIIDDPWALTYSLHSWEHFAGAGNLELKMLSVNGIKPNLENINSKKYPLIITIYLVTRKDLASDSNAAKLRDWLLTTNGQRLVLEAGYIPVRARD